MGKVRFLVNFIGTYGSNGWSPNSTFLGGTEESVVEWAKEIHKRGHEVTVYHNGEHGNFDGVEYVDRMQYKGGDGKTINVKSSEVAPQEPTWYLTNETDANRLNLNPYEAVILPSKWAADNLKIRHRRIAILPHGYDSKEIYAGDKIRKQCLYASSPDRGLELALEAWPQVRKQHPDATLIVTYGYEDSEEGVLAMGEVDTSTMNELFRTSDIWVHPCTGGELFGMTGIKAQVAECVPLYFPTMALEETVRFGVRSSPESLVDDWVRLLGNENKKKLIRQRLKNQEYPDWQKTTDMLLDIIGE